MRRTLLGFRSSLCLALALAGCVSLSPQKKIIKAPTHDEEYRLPPDDTRFSQPPQFPKGTLNKDNHNKDQEEFKDSLPKSGMGKLNAGGGGG